MRKTNEMIKEKRYEIRRVEMSVTSAIRTSQQQLLTQQQQQRMREKQPQQNKNFPTIRITKLESRKIKHFYPIKREKNLYIPFKLVQKKYLNPIPIQTVEPSPVL